jgi:hypothetical protein
MLSYCFSLGLYFDPESGGDMCLRMFGSHSADYMALYSGRQAKRRGTKLTTQFQLAPKSRKYGSIQPFPNTHSWRWDYWLSTGTTSSFIMGNQERKIEAIKVLFIFVGCILLRNIITLSKYTCNRNWDSCYFILVYSQHVSTLLVKCNITVFAHYNEGNKIEDIENTQYTSITF